MIMNVPKNKLGLDGTQELEILNVRVEPEDLDEIIDGEKYFRGWHMNKKSWMTVRLDDTLTDEEIFAWLARSFRLAGKR